VGGIPPAKPSQFRSDIFKQTPPIFTFCEIVRNSLGMVFFCNFEGIFKIAKERAVGNVDVPFRYGQANRPVPSEY